MDCVGPLVKSDVVMRAAIGASGPSVDAEIEATDAVSPPDSDVGAAYNCIIFTVEKMMVCCIHLQSVGKVEHFTYEKIIKHTETEGE